MSDKESITSKLDAIITTLTDNAQQAAVKKSKELGFDLTAGEIPFQETLINLSNIREVLKDAIRRGRVNQLPLKLQYRLQAEATKVKTQLDAMVSGSDAAVTLESAVEDLNATIWQLNLQNLSEGILGLDSKMNELKNLEVSLKGLLTEAEKLNSIVSALNETKTDAAKTLTDLSQVNADAQKTYEGIETSASKAAEYEQKALASASVVEANATSIAAFLTHSSTSSESIASSKRTADKLLEDISTIKAAFTGLEEQVETFLETSKADFETEKSNLTADAQSSKEDLSEEIERLVAGTKKAFDEKSEADSTAIKQGLSELNEATLEFKTAMDSEHEERRANARTQLKDSANKFGEVASKLEGIYTKRFDELAMRSQENTEKNDKESVRLTTYLAELEARIHDSIERATGYTLFHAFQSRQEGLRRATVRWAQALGVCVAISAGLSVYFIHSVTQAAAFGPTFYMKFSVSLPIIFAITFCSVQYSRERRLEEEYAFKSSISISLEPYRKLVGELINDENPTEVAKYTDFLIASISGVFSSPTSHVFDSDGKENKDTGGLLKTAGNVAEQLIKAKTK